MGTSGSYNFIYLLSCRTLKCPQSLYDCSPLCDVCRPRDFGISVYVHPSTIISETRSRTAEPRGSLITSKEHAQSLWRCHLGSEKTNHEATSRLMSVLGMSRVFSSNSAFRSTHVDTPNLLRLLCCLLLKDAGEPGTCTESYTEHLRRYGSQLARQVVKVPVCLPSIPSTAFRVSSACTRRSY